MYWLKKTLVLWLTKHLLPIVDERNAIAFNRKGDLFLGGVKATEQQIKNLKEDVKNLEQSELWNIINTYLNKVAEKRIVIESKDFNDVLTGKMILYTFDIQNKILEKIKNLK